MRRIRIPWMFDVIAAIDALDHVLVGQTISSMLFPLHQAKNILGNVYASSPYSSHLRISRESAVEVDTSLREILGDGTKNDRTAEDYEIWLLKYRKDAFKPIFISEMSTLPSFLVVEKEGYDVNLLIDEGWRLFPPTLRAKVPTAIRDAVEVGKAIAFELPTAAGFHIFRVVESVLKLYWDQVSGGTARPLPETIGVFAAALENNSLGDPKIWESLKQLGKLHRNPLIHPEVILNVGEEIETLGIARSVVGAMLRVLPDLPTTTSTPAITP